MNKIIANFRAAIEAEEIESPVEIKTDGQLHRFSTNGDPADKAGWYKCHHGGSVSGGAFADMPAGWREFHPDIVPCGAFGDMRRSDEQFLWIDDTGPKLTAEDKNDIKIIISLSLEEFHRKITGERRRVEFQAREIWHATQPASDEHPYLIRKQVKAHGIKTAGDILIIPLWFDDELVSLQYIEHGGKRFLPDGRLSGCYFVIGSTDDSEKICIAESYGVGASIHEATKLPVVIAFDVGNLGNVAREFHKQFPKKQLVICANDDHLKNVNSGMREAKAAALETDGFLACPEFQEKDLLDGNSDFNVMARLYGSLSVASAIFSAEPPTDNSELRQPESDEEIFLRLAELTPMEYERVRETEAKRLKTRVSVLDKTVTQIRKDAKGKSEMFPTVALWLDPVDGEELFNELLSVVKRFIICDNKTAVATVLWCAFTWFIDVVKIAPLAVITAPEKRCGKSLLLSLMGRLCRRPLVASNISAAAVFRVIDANVPTLLIDEADSFMNDYEELRGVVNSGHTRDSSYVIRTVGDDHEPKQFSTWGAKALAGIGSRQETIMDRSIILELRRKLPTEKVERLRYAEKELFSNLASKLARFAEDSAPLVEKARPTLPEQLNDRAQDNWEPLLAISECIGGEWPQLAWDTALALSGSESDSLSLSVELLSDIREVFNQKKCKHIFSTELLRALSEDEHRPWATFNKGKPMGPRQLAKLLNLYGIKPKNIRGETETQLKGYRRKQFEDAFERYLSQPIP